MITYVFEKYHEKCAFQLLVILQWFIREIFYFRKKLAYFLAVSIVFFVHKQNFTAQ